MVSTAIRTYLLPWLRIHRLRLLLLFAGVLIPLYIFGMLAEDVSENESFFFDRYILVFVHNHASAMLDKVMLFFSLIGSFYIIAPFTIIVLFMLARRHLWSDALFWSLAAAGSKLLNIAAKHSFGRIRPDLWPSIASETTFSFPSGHAMQSMTLVAALVVFVWPTRWRWPALIVGGPFVLMVGLSRVYLGVHYPSDILAAWTASLAWVIGLSLVLYGHLIKSDQRNFNTASRPRSPVYRRR